MKKFAIIAALGAASALTTPASAISVIIGPPVQAHDYTFTFTGLCTDCTLANDGIATFGRATLKVQDYVLNDELTTDNFVSFSYAGTNLAQAFTLTSVDFFSGSLNTVPGPYDVSLGLIDGSYSFDSSSTGTWNLFTPDTRGVADYGTAGTYAGAITNDVPTSDVPEPASWAMMVGGFGLIGAAMRRRARTSVTFA